MTEPKPPAPSVDDEWIGWLIEETWISPLGGGTLYIHRDFDVDRWREECDRVRDMHRRRQKFCTKDASEAMRFETFGAAIQWLAAKPTWLNCGQYQAREHAALAAAQPSPSVERRDNIVWPVDDREEWLIDETVLESAHTDLGLPKGTMRASIRAYLDARLDAAVAQPVTDTSPPSTAGTEED